MDQIFNLKKVGEHIYHIEFGKQYDCCMTFLRYQEFYESPSNRVNGKPFTIVEFMKWYYEDNGKFSYVDDWGGFNIAISIIREVQRAGIPDPNMYDSLMAGIVDMLSDEEGYLIGTYVGSDTIDHEMVHATYYTNNEYKEAVNKIISSMDVKLYKKLEKKLLDCGYCSLAGIVFDEINAYAVTGDEEFGKITNGREYKKIRKQLKDLYESLGNKQE